MSKSILFNTDSYKTCMWKIYPENTTGIYSYIESRGGEYDKTVFFGLQAFIKEYLMKPITQQDIEFAEEIWTMHGEPFNREGWEYILNTHKGYLPLIIRAVPEGSVIPVKNVLVTVENTDPLCYWLTTWIETALLRAIWYPTTVATNSYESKQIILDYLRVSGKEQEIDYKLHDFGSRGVSSAESSGIGGAAHLINFKGTDNMLGVLYAREHYGFSKESNVNGISPLAGYSVPASEHSISSSFGRENERDYVLRMLSLLDKDNHRVVSMVADTYDVFNFCKLLGTDPEIKEKIEDAAAWGGLVVVRPDSGDPKTVVLKCLEILHDYFGSYEGNYKVLNGVKVLQGDGIDSNMINTILDYIDLFGYSADTVIFGQGGALLQKLDRDTQKFAMKCSAACINGEWVDVQKDPSTDSGKRSKPGRVTLWKNGSEYESSVNKPTRWVDNGIEWVEVLSDVFRDGVLLKQYTFDEVRENSLK